MQNVTILDIWSYRDRSDLGSTVVDTHADLTGFGVEAVDGSIGKVDEAEEKVFVNRTKEQIKNAPEYDDSLAADDTYRSDLGSYYGPGGSGYRDWDDSL